ncbi:hypothetical protein ACN23B_23160 [Anabaena sp. FACHB-709]|uniref:Uncharacterized protein n=2 Tax=Nostocaceae TaxID=1162 RepID=A0A1Z4KMQ3_ANAVA|nr:MULTISPECIES: hypothetical protein [Nostocaceae]BAY70227.1 hypothetical protein NIES23_30280 [Trichormus variabilis NIES-23]HBW29317.1 hypothetical protein [Nostoc sp. UBA8866]MBD2174894.1 hypothetical protein [Anabaena cylindrica FACHB-318]MBD2266766.1 hypothetical protein [Anabaena sp. FACHB-709]MBD2276318.1 hypothetical protein [Nostoc sp. PCC 7120 = FACHB-418]
MSIIICPGIHDSDLTESFVSGCLGAFSGNSISQKPVEILVVPVAGVLTLSSLHILQFLHDRLGNKLKSPVIFISFSAGVVGAIAAAWQWQNWGGHVKAFIAIDGWGVPLWGNFPIHRLSHDYFTHWSSLLLGSGQTNFYAEPPVEHLTMWRSPQTVQGWQVDMYVKNTTSNTRLTAAEFLHLLLRHYEAK